MENTCVLVEISLNALRNTTNYTCNLQDPVTILNYQPSISTVIA